LPPKNPAFFSFFAELLKVTFSLPSVNFLLEESQLALNSSFYKVVGLSASPHQKTSSLFKKGFIDANSQLRPVVGRSWIALLTLFGFCQALRFYFEWMTSYPVARLQAEIGLTLTDFFQSLTLAFIIPLRILDHSYARNNRLLGRFFQKHGMPLIIETLRAISRILLWSLLFIVPGIFKQIRYFMVPYVTLFDPEYERGEVDALEHSNVLVRGITLPLLLVLGADLTLELFLSEIHSFFPVLDEMILRILFGALTMLVAVYTNCLVFSVYRSRHEALTGRKI